MQQIRGDAGAQSSSSAAATLPSSLDFTTTSGNVGPGPHSLLSAASAAQASGSQAASLVAAAEREAATWYTANAKVYTLGAEADYSNT